MKDIFSFPFLTRKMLSFQHSAAFSLLVNLIAHTTDPIELRGFTREGMFTFRIVPVGDSSIETFTFPIPDLPVAVSVLMSTEATAGRSAFCALHLNINTNRSILLAQGMLDTLVGVSWPNQHPLTPMQSDGAILFVSGADPAAGSEVSDTVPENQTWQILGVGLELECDANAADRTVTIHFEPSVEYLIRRASTVTQQATETIVYAFVPDGTSGASIANANTEVAIPPNIFLPASSVISTVTTNIQVGDNFAAPRYLIRRFYNAAT